MDTCLALDRHSQRGLKGSRILLVGISYKKNVSDMRESPSIRLMELLEREGSQVDFLDPHVPVIPATRDHPGLTGRTSIDAEKIAGYTCDAVLIATDHDAIDYAALLRLGVPVVDTRNAIARRGLPMTLVSKA